MVKNQSPNSSSRIHGLEDCSFKAQSIAVKLETTATIPIIIWLVVYLPLWNIGVRQLGWWHSQYDGKNNPFMFQSPQSVIHWSSGMTIAQLYPSGYVLGIPPPARNNLLMLHAGVKAYGPPAHGRKISTVPAEERNGAEAVLFFVDGRWSVITTLLSDHIFCRRCDA